MNVKHLEFKKDLGEFIKYTFKPNFRTLGKQVGKKMKEVQAAIKNLNGAESKEILDRTGELKIGEFILTPEDLEILIEQTEGFLTVQDGDLSFALETKLTPELIEEGFVRELISKIQTMRKENGFEVTDRIKIFLSGNSKLAEISKRHESEISKIVLGDSIEYDKLDGFTKEWNINGETVSIGVK